MSLPYLVMLRPTQWLKNLMLFFPPFLSGQMLLPGVAESGLPLFAAFCLVSSAGYILNDLIDRERDAVHPRKRLRAIASAAVTVRNASLLAALLLVLGLLLAGQSSPVVLALLVAYAVNSLLYSLVLKSMPLVDLFCISAGFLIRLQAGGEMFQVPISPWLFLSVFLLSVFLSTGKRLSESHSLGSCAGEHRVTLSSYPAGFLAGTMYMTGSAVLVTYAMYVVLNPQLIITVPLCLFGLLRYILRVSSGENGDPTESLLKDWILFAVSSIWLVLVVWSIYR
jgi:decaprenyl-phosphate phosphoribosyltransferase